MGNDARHAFVAHNSRESKIVNCAGPSFSTRTGMRPWALSSLPLLNDLLTFLFSFVLLREPHSSSSKSTWGQFTGIPPPNSPEFGKDKAIFVQDSSRSADDSMETPDSIPLTPACSHAQYPGLIF
jgi:hypothetical protein